MYYDGLETECLSSPALPEPHPEPTIDFELVFDLVYGKDDE